MTARRPLADKAFEALALAVLCVALSALAVLIADVWSDGASRLSWQFLSSFPSRHPEDAGIRHALAGSIVVIALTAALAVPIGVAAAIYLEEYGTRGLTARIIEINITNLAAVPSIIYGLLGLGLSLSWGMLRQINLTHFALAFLGGYLTFQLSGKLDPFVALAITAPAFFMLGVALHWFFTRFKVTLLNTLLVTFGLTSIIEAGIQWTWTADFQPQGRYALLAAVLLTVTAACGPLAVLSRAAGRVWATAYVAFLAAAALEMALLLQQRPCASVKRCNARTFCCSDSATAPMRSVRHSPATG